MNRFFIIPKISCIFLSIILSSCSSGKLPVYPVELSINADNKPAVGVEVVLHPQDQKIIDAKLFPNGRTDENGVVNISTYQEGDGAPAGKYKMTLVWKMNMAAGNDDPEGASVERDRFGDRFSNPKTTPHEITIGNEALTKTIDINSK